jgi:hypothetical protein
VDLMYTALEDGDLAACSFETSFSQILEMDNLGENPQARVELMITGAYFDMVPNTQEGRLISLELHVVAQGICHDTVTVGYIADAFSNAWPLELETEDLALNSMERQSSLRETVHETAETPEPVRDIICVYPIVGASGADSGKIRCSILMCCIYRGESGNIGKVSKRFSVESAVEVDADMELHVTRVSCAEVYATVASNGIELRLPIDMDFTVVRKAMLKSVTSIMMDEENPLNNLSKPSLTALYPGAGADIWGLAKKYGSTPELITQANELPEDGSIFGQLLLIPRER